MEGSGDREVFVITKPGLFVLVCFGVYAMAAVTYHVLDPRLQSRSYSAMSVDKWPARDLEHTHKVPDGSGCFNKPVMPRWLAVFLTSEFSLLKHWRPRRRAMLYRDVVNSEYRIINDTFWSC